MNRASSSHAAEPSSIDAAVQQQQFAISAEIHDALLPYLFVTRMRLESLHHRLSGEYANGEEAPAHHQQNLQLILDSIHSIDTAQRIGRNLLRSLDSEELLEHSWNDFLKSVLHRIASDNEQISVKGSIDDELPRFVRVAIRGIAREAITNAIRHGKAKQVDVMLSELNQSHGQLQISDNGHGFAPEQRTLGYGTRFMQVRAATIGATLSVDSQVGGPTILKLTW